MQTQIIGSARCPDRDVNKEHVWNKMQYKVLKIIQDIVYSIEPLLNVEEDTKHIS